MKKLSKSESDHLIEEIAKEEIVKNNHTGNPC
jgi:hypothetical protein